MAYTSDELDYLLAQSHSFLSDATSGLSLSTKTMVADVSALRASHGEYARAVVELELARRSAAAKFGEDQARSWFMDSESTQQATPAVVAAFRAAYLRSLGVDAVVDVTCSIGTELHACRKAGMGTVMGGDLDLQRVRMAHRNVPDVPVVAMDATRPALSLAPGMVALADPARRNSSGRVTKLQDLRPRLDELEIYPEAAVKCAPGIDYSTHAGQVDIVSVDGQVKEACLYTPGLSRVGRRAVMLGVASPQETVTSEMEAPERIGPVGRYIIDPDGAVVRAGLVRHYAARHGLWQLDPRIAYLTGDTVPERRRGFEVREVVPMKQLKAALAARGVGAVEILIRGVDVTPEALRKKWKLKGSEAATVVLTRVGTKAWGYICDPVRG
ncbi:MAG TPA: SAM-dependent methyltransferase [Candidatus Corynebacterium gallistercoris]|uniref:SAM-dependent methyltransferase n=1 Tax=Candidatus Corynebacterium gallistercoris TaxID=2838530 RepID=A0A9D1RXQ1_9CORY|nr:SAM-dependent methyltransferase [Candidatus Corynebacterium gallistercoris]